LIALTFSSAYLLVSHGSRDPRPQIAIEHLAKLVAQRLQPVGSAMRTAPLLSRTVGTAPLVEPIQSAWRSAPPVGTAELELAALPLHQQIVRFAEFVLAQGYTHLQIMPLFLLPGVHVMQDIPTEIRLAQQAIPANLTLEVCPHLGSHARLPELLINPVDPIATAATASKILLAHGSRRAGGNQPVESIATQLGALPAYWSVEPGLETRVIERVRQGSQQIAILPYFLFEGGITDAIAQEVQHLAQQFPYVQLQLGQAIGPSSQLADCIVELLRDR